MSRNISYVLEVLNISHFSLSVKPGKYPFLQKPNPGKEKPGTHVCLSVGF